MRVTSVRRLKLAVLVSVSVLVGVLAAVAAAAVAATQFGSLGSEAGQLNFPAGVAVDVAGDVYVGDVENNRVDKFDRSGSFLLAWGAGVVDGAEALQTCTTSCRKGHPSSVAGGFEFPAGVAVDASGDVYVVDHTHARVEKFDSQGQFILMFGGHVNETTEGNVCVAGEACKEGVQGTEDGQFSYWNSFGAFIAVSPGGKVYVGDKGRVQVFEPSGAWKENISLAGLSREVEGEVIEAEPNALTVDSAGDVFLTAPGIEGVREFEANGTEKLSQFDAGSASVTALALDSSGDLYVGDSTNEFQILKYDTATGKKLASFGSKTVSSFDEGMALSEAAGGELYASDSGEARVWVVPVPPPGPLIDSESATPAPKGKATLQAQVNPEGNETISHFEYVDEEHFKASGYTSATSTVPVSIGSEIEGQPAQVELTGLVPGETYHWRVVASNECEAGKTCTHEGVDQTFEETPPALIEGPWTEDVASTSTTLAAQINPLGANTSYRLEYGTTTSYEHLFTGNVGEGMGLVPITSHHLQELEPGTTYHYRIVTTSVVGTVHGADHTFTTQPSGANQFALPDGRAWELVTPANTGGTVLQLWDFARQAASDGSAITYPVQGTPLGENVVSNNSVQGNHVLSLHGPGGWRSEDINLLISPPGEEDATGELPLGTISNYPLFSSNLALAAVVLPKYTSLSSEALEGTPYLRNNVNGSYAPLLTPANTPPGTNLMRLKTPYYTMTTQVYTLAGTPDLGHIVLGSPLKLTEEAFQNGENIFNGNGNLYEWSAGRLQLVNRLPKTGEATHDVVSVEFAGGAGGAGAAPRAVSTDGRRIAWTRGDPYGEQTEKYIGLYVRDMVEGKTVQLGGHGALYQTMNSDGSRVFFLEKGELYEYDAATGAQTDLTANHGAGEVSAGVQASVTDVSKDGSYVYFVAKGVLAEGAVSGADNLYLLHAAGGNWSTSYVTTLSSEDEPSWQGVGSGGTSAPDLTRISSRVSPNGRYLTFMSTRSLTGYDNTDARSGQPDAEVYLYDALAGRLACASCDPTGARPVGIFTGGAVSGPGGLVELHGGGPWSAQGHPHWVAGTLPGWQLNTSADTVYQPRYLSDSGRLYFDSPDALVPHDTNELEDVYEYEPTGVGGCTSASAMFSGRSGGCVNLISSGTSSSESAFMDASESGDDVFFLTSDRLTAADSDTGYDVWDARVCSASAPCHTPPVSPPACSSGDSCKPAPAPQPELFGPAPSATFSGAGNIAPAVKPKSKPAKCKKGFVKKHNKCVKAKAKKKKPKGKKASDKRRGKS